MARKKPERSAAEMWADTAAAFRLLAYCCWAAAAAGALALIYIALTPIP